MHHGLSKSRLCKEDFNLRVGQDPSEIRRREPPVQADENGPACQRTKRELVKDVAVLAEITQPIARLKASYQQPIRYARDLRSRSW